jgi:hypothetical protein
MAAQKPLTPGGAVSNMLSVLQDGSVREQASKAFVQPKSDTTAMFKTAAEGAARKQQQQHG